MLSIEVIELELVELRVQRRDVDVRIQALEALLKAYRGELPEQDIGITDAVRHVFRQRPNEYLSALLVRDILQSQNFNLSRYKNPMAVIHQVISRLNRGELIDAMVNGKKKFRWGLEKYKGE